jgi:hypothetical protein
VDGAAILIGGQAALVSANDAALEAVPSMASSFILACNLSGMAELPKANNGGLSWISEVRKDRRAISDSPMLLNRRRISAGDRCEGALGE